MRTHAVLDSETVQDYTGANGCDFVTKQSDSYIYGKDVYSAAITVAVTCQLIFSCILKHQLLMLLGIS